MRALYAIKLIMADTDDYTMLTKICPLDKLNYYINLSLIVCYIQYTELLLHIVREGYCIVQMYKVVLPQLMKDYMKDWTGYKHSLPVETLKMSSPNRSRNQLSLLCQGYKMLLKITCGRQQQKYPEIVYFLK